MKRFTVFLMLIACAGLSACGKKEGAVREETKTAPPAAASNVSPQLMALFPAKNEVPGWGMTQSPRSFTAANLWEFIDGAADGYLAYGFEEVGSADYAQETTGNQAVVDIYKMKDPLNAYGIYSQERNPEYAFTKIGVEGYTGGATAIFWAGAYYVKITAFEEKDALKQELIKIANSIAAKVPSRGGEPTETSYFPKTNQMPHTIVYIPKDVLAQSYFTNGFEAKYKTGDKEHKMVLVAMENPPAAKDAIARYRQFLSTGGRQVKDLKGTGEEGFSGKDSFYGNMAAIRAGRNIIVVLGVSNEEAGKKAISDMLGNIK